MLQGLFKKVNNSVYGGNIRKDNNDQYKCLPENWMKENYDDRVQEWWPLKNGNLIVGIEFDTGVEDQDLANSNNQMPCDLCNSMIGHSKRLKNNVFREIDGF